MSIFKKIISLTLVFLLVFSCLPTAAFAEEIEAETEIQTEEPADNNAQVETEEGKEE